MQKAGDMINGSVSDSITAGYEVLGGLFLGLVGSLGYLFILVLILMAVAVVVLLVPGIVSGVIAKRKYKKTGEDVFRTDCILKIIGNGILALFCLKSFDFKYPTWLLFALVPVIVTGLCIWSLVMKEIISESMNNNTTKKYKTKPGFIHAERASVCMGDDCNAPNAEELAYDNDMLLSDFMAVIMNYVPAMSNCRWIIFFGKERTAVLTGNERAEYSYELLVPDRKVSELANTTIFCKYEY